jgi:hypothetical protein
VAHRLSGSRPDMKVIFMSGYTEGEFGPGSAGPLEETILLQKPFQLSVLAAKIREVLHARTQR